MLFLNQTYGHISEKFHSKRPFPNDNEDYCCRSYAEVSTQFVSVVLYIVYFVVQTRLIER